MASTNTIKLLLRPEFNSPDKGDGGIRRVVEAQRKHLPQYDIELVDTLSAADVVAVHAGVWIDTPPSVPTVSHCHGLYWSDSEWDRWCNALNKDVIAAARRADIVTAPSNWVAQALRRGLWANVPVLWHGVELDEWEPALPRDVAGYALWNKTRVDPACDPTPVFELAARAPDVKFVVTISPDAIKRHKLRYPDNVRITDVVGYEGVDNKALVREAGVYLATTRETFGIGTLEAMAAGVPILGWAWGGQAEFVRHKETGWLSRPGDYDDLREGLYWCLAHRAMLGEAARQDVAERFTWVQQVAHYRTVYDSVFHPQSQPKAGAGSMPTQPKVSVIIPCYNLGHYLTAAVESVVQQKGIAQDDIEVVICDDASTDNSREIAAVLAQTYPNVVATNNPTNLYLAGNLNRAIGMSHGAYIIPLDADNMLGERALATLAGALDASRDIDIAYGGVMFVDEAGRPDNAIGAGGVSGWPPQVFDFEGQLTFPRSYIPSTAMYRRRVWEAIGGYRTRWRTGEDADFWCRATSVGFMPRKVTDATTLAYRQRADSMSRTNERRDWTLWYPWARDPGKRPFAAPLPGGAIGSVGAASGGVGTGAANNDAAKRLIVRVPPLVPVQVSVIIPVGPGHEAIVVDAIDSVVAQTFENWEIVLVDDVDDYEGGIPWYPSFVRYIHTGGTHNPAQARNLGIEASTAPLFVLLDADDFLRPDALTKLYEAWREHKGYIYTDWAVAENGRIMEAEEFSCTALLTHIPHTITAMYARDDWQRAGGFNEQLAGWEDWDFLLRLTAVGVCGMRYPEPLLTYRATAGYRHERLEKDKDTYKAEMYTQWGDYVDGRKTMPCGGCGGRSLAQPKLPTVGAANGGGGNISMMMGNSAGQVPLASDAVLLEYVGSAAATITYRGAKTGTSYRFGPDAAHKRRYVYAQDAEGLLRQDALKRVDADTGVLV